MRFLSIKTKEFTFGELDNPSKIIHYKENCWAEEPEKPIVDLIFHSFEDREVCHRICRKTMCRVRIIIGFLIKETIIKEINEISKL